MEASVRLPPGGAVTGWAAGRLHGAAYLDGTAGGQERPVPLALGSAGHVRPTPGVRLLREQIPCDELTVVAGVPCTTPERATYDAARLAGERRAAVRVLDMAFAGEITSRSRMAAYLERRRRVAPLVRGALGLAFERSLSPPETDVRLIWELDAGLPPALANVPVLDRAGRLIGVPDLFDVETRVAVEYDGADHRSRRRHAADVDRESHFREAGCALVRVVAPNLRRPAQVVARFQAEWGRALARVPERPGWRLGDPGPALDDRIADREALDRQYQAWLDDPVGPPPS